jgi:hypothetical protein
MSEIKIIFGTKRLGQSAAVVSAAKYPNKAVITVEGVKGAKKSRRILMNAKAAELLGCTVGELQELSFGWPELGPDSPKQVLIANSATFAEEPGITYRTSKNKVSFGEDTSEKGKAITSSHVCNEIFNFLNLDDSANAEFELNAFDNPSLEAFTLDAVSADNAVIETNIGEMNAEEVVNSTMAEVQAAEEANPVLEQIEEPQSENLEMSGSAVSNTSDWL